MKIGPKLQTTKHAHYQPTCYEAQKDNVRPFTKGFLKILCAVKQHRNLTKFEIEGDCPLRVYEVIYKCEVLVVYPFGWLYICELVQLPIPRLAFFIFIF